MDADQSAAAIRHIVAQAGEITGSKLASELRSLAPNWDADAFGSSSLREFIEEQVSGVAVAGRSGMDLIYKPQTELAAPKPRTKQLWTTWVSPFGRYALFVDPRTGQVDQLPRAAASPKDMQRLVSPTEADHLTLAKAFLDAQPQLQPQLANVLNAPGRQWWRQWFTKVDKVGRLKDWKAFRQAKLEDRLRIELEAAVDGDEHAARAFSAITQTNPAGGGHVTSPEVQVDSVIATKRAIIETIERLSDDQVRFLQEAFEVISNAFNQRSK